MSAELAKKYAPAEVEQEVLARWQAQQVGHAEPDPAADPFVIVIPPPNVTAALHLGHALNNTLQDILIRRHRMGGDNTVWIPGTDHAGIATQTVVEKRVLAEEGKRRTDFARDAFVAKVQSWKDEYEKTILGQLMQMGCSCDWQRTRFTMDQTCARAVREAFFRLFRDGLIYRGKRLVNWDPVTQTALADDEVEMQEIDGHFYYMKYPLAEPAPDGTTHVTVATTRPETMLGDTAVAINPRDGRADSLVGRTVLLPIVNRPIPIIADEHVVLPDAQSDDPKARFASGFLKVTPAHDPNDWEIGLRHGLAVINVMGPDGSISAEHGWEADDLARADGDAVPLGLDRFEARRAVVDWFKGRGLLEDVRPYRHSVGHSYRSHVPIEPYLSDQWYVRVTDDRLAGAALRAMADEQVDAATPNAAARRPGGQAWEGRLRFHPPRYAKAFQLWHENIRDWCISRQLWWGHRIPVWTRDVTLAQGDGPIQDRALAALGDGWREQAEAQGTLHLRAEPHPDDPGAAVVYVCARDPGSALEAWLEQHGFAQDPDVLDTWFSSALWPFSTLGWPDETPALTRWNPGSVLATARDIITLWVSRMVMTNLYFRGCLPFTDVYIHPMIQDGQGRRMSKSLGNGVDPLDIIHSHGADAMRFTLAQMATSTQDARLPVTRDPATGRNTSERFDAGRNFANKLWNAVRFAMTNLEGEPTDQGQTGLADRWILSRMAQALGEADRAIAAYEFAAYAQCVYSLTWHDLCDWYIEAVKPTLRASAAQRRVLATCLDLVLRLLHPIMPFVTEKLWERLNAVAPQRGLSGIAVPPSELLATAAWPRATDELVEPGACEAFDRLRQVVGAIREARTTHKVPPRQSVPCSAQAPADLASLLTDERALVETLAGVEVRQLGPDVSAPAGAATAVVGQARLYLHNLVDADAEAQRLNKQLDELDKQVANLEKRLANKSYVDKAPAHLVDETRQQLTEAQRQAAEIRQQLQSL